MSTDDKRAFLMTLYGDRWKRKVVKMSDAQVIAVYGRIQSKQNERMKRKQR